MLRKIAVGFAALLVLPVVGLVVFLMAFAERPAPPAKPPGLWTELTDADRTKLARAVAEKEKGILHATLDENGLLVGQVPNRNEQRVDQQAQRICRETKGLIGEVQLVDWANKYRILGMAKCG